MNPDLRWFHGYPRASGRLVCQARLRAMPADFVVDERMDVPLTDDGEHVWVQVEKTSLNTRDVADALARFAGIKPASVGYSGLKDKIAVCRQWFSVPVPVLSSVDFKAMALPGCVVLQQQRHQRKLRTGTHTANHFMIRLRDVVGKPDVIDARLDWIRRQGVPNAFGEQRFGYARNNITRLLAWQHQRSRKPSRHAFGLWLSAARSFLFNEILYRRVIEDSWCLPQVGDVMMLAGTHSVFPVETVDDVLLQRVQEADVHVSAPLWGEGGMVASGVVAALEAEVVKPYHELVDAIGQQRVEMHRRALRVCVPDLQWQWESSNTLCLSLTLPPGAFATAVLHECGVMVER